MLCYVLKRTLYFIFPAHLHSGVLSFQLPKPEHGGIKIFLHNKSVPGLSVSNSSVSDKPLILCSIQLREVAQGIDGNEPELSVWGT